MNPLWCELLELRLTQIEERLKLDSVRVPWRLMHELNKGNFYPYPSISLEPECQEGE